MFGPHPVHVLGEAPLVDQVVSGLREGERVAVQITPDQLEAIRPRRMRTLVLAEPFDPAAILARCSERRRAGRWSRTTPLRVILMHRRDPPPQLPPLDPSHPLRLETFSVETRAARALLTAWPLHRGMDPRFGQIPHLLLAGFEHPAPAVLLQALRLIQYGETRPAVTILDADPQRVAAALSKDYPQAGQIADLRFDRLDRPALEGLPPVTQAFVCLPDPLDRAIDTARSLGETIARVQGVSPAILVEIGDGVADGEVGDWDGQIVPVSSIRTVCRPGVLLDGVGDEMAQSIHRHYRDSIAAQGRNPDREPAGQPWETLPVSYRQANRHQADHLWAKLALTDCGAVAEEMVESFAFTPPEVEGLAVIEHQRWAADRYLDGWTHAPERDNALKHHPQLIPYAELSEPMKDLDRFAVRGVPSLLARSGLGVVRMLILAIPDAPGAALDRRGQRRLLRPLLERLVRRYPDRALVCASTLGSPLARQLVRAAMEHAGAGLFWLLPEPLADLLARQADTASRVDLLGLAARAERRIGLSGPAELERWHAERAEILIALDEMPETPTPAKRVRVGRRGLVWDFEY
ncbi:RyR domain-containing protein [Thiorhodococcus fuscus]|uniref:RyR domain-containing protein n=1 Tax=Thiorhodococcus fuscus TaxID=527200 RepID=A0ABW4YA64_9GAMM